MDRREAMLRELNLYPQWVVRKDKGAGAAHPADQPAAIAADAGKHIPANIAVKSAPVLVAIQPVSAKPDRVGVPGWDELKRQVHDCTACRLRAGCTQTVFGVGDEQAGWLFVGEGPGADEDALGAPFVGQAGKLLDSMLMAIRLKRGNDVYIANIVKCRPPGNRNPEADEIATCMPYLQRQIELIQPRVIVALGKVASNALLGKDATLASLRGKLHDYKGTKLVVTYHPAYLLRSPSEKAKAWQDLKLAVKTFEGGV